MECMKITVAFGGRSCATFTVVSLMLLLAVSFESTLSQRQTSNSHRRSPLRVRAASGSRVRPCYDSSGRAQRCFPPFVNAAFNVPVEATNTCGGATATSNDNNPMTTGETDHSGGRRPVRRRGEFFCQQTEVHVAGSAKSCDVCDRNDPRKAHPASYLTDFHSADNLTWWQSSTMLSDVQWPNSVNLTLRLGKQFEITYVRLKFHSSRPESFAIYKRASGAQRQATKATTTSSIASSFDGFDDVSSGEVDDDKPETTETGWIPYQYYSASCEQTYGLSSNPMITHHNEATAICSDDFSDISPMSGASVAFSTLEGRPGAYEFENNVALQEWVVASELKIVLNRINTFRDEVFGDPNVLRSYFYAISDLAVGGRCLCNGHASDCYRITDHTSLADHPQGYDIDLEEPSTSLRSPSDRYGQRLLACRCEHHTAGPDCDRCLPFYNDRPWQRATSSNAYECLPCDCGGLSDECYFNAELYETTGHGGHCVNCRENTGGPHCEYCNDEFYRDVHDTGRCLPCACHPDGAVSAQCDPHGECQCKRGVTGSKCDQCQPNHYDLGPEGCRTCECFEPGNVDNHAECHPGTGTCRCKEYVEGTNCDQCKTGYFDLSAVNPLGCSPCFCYGHSSSCSASSNYIINRIRSDFAQGTDGWTAASVDGQPLSIEFSDSEELIYITPSAITSDGVAYLVAPAKFLGDQSLSYNQMLTFTLYLDDERDVFATIADIVIESRSIASDGSQQLSVSAPIYAQGNQMPSSIVHDFRFRLNEHQSYQWTPELSNEDFRRLLADITAIKIRTIYNGHGMGFLDNVELVSAAENSDYDDYVTPNDDVNGRQVALFVEQCQCPAEYEGQFCERCRAGYKHDDVTNGPYAMCVPCECHGHAGVCEPDTGRCYCEHNTTGDMCERCMPGFYGEARYGTPTDCTRCPCPNNGDCVQLLSGEVACLDCPPGHTGLKCDMCDDGYFDNSEDGAEIVACVECDCNNNVDVNSVGNCNRTTGECLKCNYNTIGFYCDRCLPGFYGNALALPHGHCLACNCYELGSQLTSPSCDMNGRCPCLDHVTGDKCNKCEEGYWNIASGTGCADCQCDTIGSLNTSCNTLNGQCHCKPGVGGTKCDQCLPNFFQHTDTGCTACNCDPEGSIRTQCHMTTGQCTCRPNVFGRQCGQCSENKYNKAAGCIDCPVCYNVVELEVSTIRARLAELRSVLEYLETRHPSQPVDDTTFLDQLASLNARFNELLNASSSYGDNSESVKRYQALLSVIDDITITQADVLFAYNMAEATLSGAVSGVSQAEEYVDRLEALLDEGDLLINIDGQQMLQEAIEAQDAAGQQSTRLTDIASEARHLADTQESAAVTVTGITSRALSTSEEALMSAEKVEPGYTSTNSEVTTLLSQLDEAASLYHETHLAANDSHHDARRSYQDSLQVLTEVESLRMPIVNIEASEISQQANSTSLEAAAVITEWTNLHHSDFNAITSSTYQELESARNQRHVTDAMMEAIVQANATAAEAVETADRMLNEAQQTLVTLKEFDEKVRSNRAKAEIAIARIPDIEDNVEMAERSATFTRQTLDEAVTDSSYAEELAQSAQETATIAFQQITHLRFEVNVTLLRISQLLSETNLTDGRLDEIEERLVILEQQADEDSQRIHEALQRAGEAKNKAEISYLQNSETFNAIDDMQAEIERTQSVDVALLDQLEQTLDVSRRRMAEIDLEGHFASLELAETDSSRWIADYRTQLLAISEDVARVSRINETLPRTCFKKIVLEPRELQPTPSDASKVISRRLVI